MSQDTTELVLHDPRHARLHMLRINGLLVEQERVGYLARYRAWGAPQQCFAAPKSYEEWLTEGLTYYPRSGEAQRWNTPFTSASL